MIEPAFYAILTGNADVAALAADRVFFGNRPQDERRPSILATRTGTRRDRSFDGSFGFDKGSMQFDALATDYPTARELADAVEAALDKFEGTADETTFDYVVVSDVRDTPTAAPLAGQATPLFGVSIDVDFLCHTNA